MKYIESKAEYLYQYRPRSQIKVYMSPNRFLSLAAKKPSPYNKERLKFLQCKILKNEELDPLFLDVDVDTHRVSEHEGRHRAMAAKLLDIKKVPVIIYLKKKDSQGHLKFIERLFIQETYPPRHDLVEEEKHKFRISRLLPQNNYS